MTSKQRPVLEFWFEFASTYSYLSAMRIEQLAKSAGVVVSWRPFLLGPIFKAQGWTTSPFNLYPAKGRYMTRDMARIASERGLRFQLPTPFPMVSLRASRLAVALDGISEQPEFVRAVYLASFAEGRDITKTEELITILSSLGLDAPALMAKAEDASIKDKLRTNTEAAMGAGIFGAPSFVTPDGELFWGDDRLEQAVGWLKHKI